jgi:hypothetical protein
MPPQAQEERMLSVARLAVAIRLSRANPPRTDGAITHRPDDASALYPIERDYDSRCCWCYANAPHSTAAHRENVSSDS